MKNYLVYGEEGGKMVNEDLVKPFKEVSGVTVISQEVSYMAALSIPNDQVEVCRKIADENDVSFEPSVGVDLL